MRRVVFALSALLLAGFLLSGADTPKTAFDKPTLEAYLRHLFLLPANLTVTVNDPKPAAMPGFKEVKVRISQGPQFQDVALYVSNDGKNIVLYAWYDNEFGYTKQVIRLAKHVTKVRRLVYY